VTGRRKFWGWGIEGAGPDDEQQAGIARTLGERFGTELAAVAPPTLAELKLAEPRLAPPTSLASVVSTLPYDRASHTYGKAFRDVVRALRRDFSCAPDLVAFPRDEADVVAILDWCAEAGAAAIPYGGGSSVVGGVEARDLADRYAGVVSVDLGALDRVLEIDRTSRCARIQGGVLGPALEDQLRPHGLTLRHFPQSFEFSTLGGWIATRSGGHYATLYTHIDDFVESTRAVTPTGVIESRRLPGSGAGPSPDRLLIGSEGILGVIVEAWMPASSTAPRRPTRAQARSRCWCWASSRQTTPSTPGWPARSSAAAMRVGRSPKGRRAPAPTRAPRGRVPPAPGVKPSSRRPTCATS
jgi:alkyldihydroxyacetonephosphate synthase